MKYYNTTKIRWENYTALSPAVKRQKSIQSNELSTRVVDQKGKYLSVMIRVIGYNDRQRTTLTPRW